MRLLIKIRSAINDNWCHLAERHESKIYLFNKNHMSYSVVAVMLITLVSTQTLMLHRIIRACPYPVLWPDKAQGQGGSGLLVTSANCPDGPASSLLFNTSCSVGVYRHRAQWQLPPSQFYPNRTAYPLIPGPLRCPYHLMKRHGCEQ